ncbi:YtxH domain-containing protein [Pontibacillus marinus]|uniref:General stress protein n=1 Tax=Pontibacillus marinus BH030004 = DSM 16465 TaxID=1385511 RepID=A0A0A5GDG0_9BACI|nr:YtxH domain-containing protein [Pontibacillus marinus]KGX89999.1 hypothetical protein N783_02280 [Pontibacillus marinus BH030004 = DSM 16465]
MTNTTANVKQATKATSKKGLVTGTIIGGVVGATASLLLAPKGGKELREDLSQQSKVALDKGKDLKDRTTEKSKKLLNTSDKNDGPLPAEDQETPPVSEQNS